MALLDNAPPILREVLNYSYSEKVNQGIYLAEEMIHELTRTYSMADTLDILLTLVIYAVSGDHSVDEQERRYFNAVFGDYREYYTLREFHSDLSRVNCSYYYDLMYHALARHKELQANAKFLFWLFICANGTVTADEFRRFDEFLCRLQNSK